MVQPNLQSVVEEALKLGADLSPPVGADREKLAIHLARHLRSRPPPHGTWSPARLRDLLICAACLAGDNAALSHFDDLLAAQATTVLPRVEPDPLARDDALQTVRLLLLLGTENRSPRLCDYRGVGSLSGWLRTSLVRQALNAR